MRLKPHNSRYAGMRGKSQKLASKYRDCEYVRCQGSTVRKLSADEIGLFQSRITAIAERK